MQTTQISWVERRELLHKHMVNWKRAKDAGLIINVEKTKAVGQSRRLGKGRTPTVQDHKIEVIRRFKYLGTVINDVSDKMEEIRARILAANKAYNSLQTIFRSKQIHRNMIRLYKTLSKPILWKRNLDLNPNVRADAKHVWKENIAKNIWSNILGMRSSQME